MNLLSELRIEIINDEYQESNTEKAPTMCSRWDNNPYTITNRENTKYM
jgi:hypothetical protein